MDTTISLSPDLLLNVKHAPAGWFVHLEVSSDVCDWRNTWKCYSPANPSIKWVYVDLMGRSEVSQEDAIVDLRKSISKEIKSLSKKVDPRLSMVRRLELLKSLDF